MSDLRLLSKERLDQIRDLFEDRHFVRELLDHIDAQAELNADLLAACRAFVEAWEKSLQLEKTDVALRMAKAAIAKAEGR